LANVTNLSFEGVDGEGLLIGLDMQGICASSGSACSSGQTEPSHVLLSMGLPIELAKGSVRFSLGWENTEEEVDRVIEVFPSIVERLRNLSPVWSDLQKGIRPSVIERLHHE
jgi:cysteine desulfurase